ncbi:MAG: C1 family peptidase [Saprospiraceae bacterium]|nr:C1 family peptidase [Saprospiraceae bacterium]
MRELILLSFFSLFTFFLANAQPRTADFGIVNAQLIDEYLMIVPGVGSRSREMLNAQSVKEYLMPVRRINANDSGLAYAITTCLEFYVNLDKNYKVNLSPDYISLNILSQGKRMNTNDAMQILAQDGTVSAAILPFGAKQLTSGVYATEKFKIANYLHLFRAQTRNRQKVFETKKALSRGNPVLIELKANEQFPYIKETKLVDSYPAGDQSYHVVVVGYDENLEAFEIRNTQGSKWGVNGYLWIKYDDFGSAVTNAYVIVPN